MANDAPNSMNPNALPVENAAHLLTKAGGRRITVDCLRADIDAGAPTSPDGTLNLIHYAAWLIKEMARGD